VLFARRSITGKYNVQNQVLELKASEILYEGAKNVTVGTGVYLKVLWIVFSGSIIFVAIAFFFFALPRFWPITTAETNISCI
jgi:hypothetical protein